MIKENVLKEKLAELNILGFNENSFEETELNELGIQKNSIEEAMLYCEVKINEYWVDIPVSLRDAEAKEYAKKCNAFKKVLKELKALKKSSPIS